MDGYRIERDGGKASVFMEADLKSALVPSMHKALKQSLKEGVSEMVFDFSKANVVDSSGIGLLVAASNSLELRGGRMAVVNAPESIAGLLKSMRLHERLGVRARSQA